MTILHQTNFHQMSAEAKRTEDLGAMLGSLLRPGDIVCLSGDLGAGKTVFSRGIGAGWGATIPLSSPTYNLVHEHQRAGDGVRLYHLDCYRISRAAEAATLGIDDILDGLGILICEWPERILDILPNDHLWIDIEVKADNGRDLYFGARGERHGALVDSLRNLVVAGQPNTSSALGLSACAEQ